MQIGTTLSQTRLSIHAARSQTWVRLQGNFVNVRGETWQANFYNGGRIQNYTLIARSAMVTPSTVQQDGAAVVK